jgi:hypothetical protein
VTTSGCRFGEQFTVSQLADPDGHALHKDLKQSTGTASITAKKDGKHEYCFSNLMSSVSDKVVRYGEVGSPD